MLHDSDPEFPRLRQSLNEDEQRCAAIRHKLDVARAREMEQLSAGYRNQIKDLRRANTAIDADKDFATARDCVAKLQKKDNQVLSLLQEYRAQLVQRAHGEKRTLRFVAGIDDPFLATKDLTPAEYQQTQLKLKYLVET